VHQAVEDGVGQGRVLHGIVPGLDRQLAGDDGGFAVVAFLDNLQQFALVLRGERRDEQIVENQHLAFAEGGR